MKLWAICGSYWMAVVRAPSEHDARMLLTKVENMDSNGLYFPIPYGDGRCLELTVDGPIEVVASASD